MLVYIKFKIYLFNCYIYFKRLLSVFCVLNLVIDIGDIRVNNVGSVFIDKKFTVIWRRVRY